MSKFINFSESGVRKRSFGKLKGVVVNSHSSGTLKLIDGLEPSVAATSVITSAGACAPASHAVSILTSDGTAFADAETVTINTTVYRFMATPALAYDVARGASAAIALDNLKLAINGTGVGDGTDYYTGTAAHPQVVATTNSNTQQTIVARVPGTTPNTYPTTETCGHASWPDTTLGGGTGASDPGVTTAAATITVGTRVYTAVLALSETSGATAIADQILWVTSEAVFLDNVKKAINASGIAGTDYSTGTTENYNVFATTNTNTEQTIVSRLLGTVGNSIATSTTLANYSWTSTVMASGTGTTGRIINNTLTFSAVATTGERFVDLGNVSFDTGLYATVGGTLDTTLIID